MDPVSHALFGRLLAGFDGREALGRGSRTAFVLGALAPDLDILLVSRGWDVYLHAHQAWIHSIALSPALALVVAGVVRVFARTARLGRLWIAAWIGVSIGHVMFDLVSGSDMQLFWPVSQARYGPHWLTMSDLLAVAIIVLATLVSLKRRRLAAQLTIIAMIVLIIVKAQSQSAARGLFLDRTAGTPGDVADASPDALSGRPFTWVFYDRVGDTVRAWTVNARTRAIDLRFSLPVAKDTLAVQTSRGVPAVATFLGLAHLPFAITETHGNRERVLWSEPHYCDADGCGLLFGADLNEHDVPIAQVIQIGSFEQTKTLPRESGQLPD
jgi:membrane-bound metal-dependent hydrolase YbcI (DUF457 family)